MDMVERDLLNALKSANAWLERWASHVGNCAGGESCSCGLSAVRFEAEVMIGVADALCDEEDDAALGEGE